MQAPDLRSEVHAYLTATLRSLECRPLQDGVELAERYACD